MEGGPRSTSDSRLCAARTRLKKMQELHGWRTLRFQRVALAFAQRTLVLTVCNKFHNISWLAPPEAVF
eukprot:1649025-Pyramimonas_sp.AAC.1